MISKNYLNADASIAAAVFPSSGHHHPRPRRIVAVHGPLLPEPVGLSQGEREVPAGPFHLEILRLCDLNPRPPGPPHCPLPSSQLPRTHRSARPQRHLFPYSDTIYEACIKISHNSSKSANHSQKYYG